MPSRFVCNDRRPRRGRGRWLAAGLLAVTTVACVTANAGTTLKIEAPPQDQDADVYIDGHYVGQIDALGDDPAGPVQLAPGQHRVEIRKAGRFPVQRTVAVDADTPPQTVIEAELLEDPS